MRINGKVVYMPLGMGFWGIEGNNGQQWRPINMPSSLKQEGKQVSVTAKRVEEGASLFMWGTPIKIISF